MPEDKIDIPQIPNNEWRDLQFRFDGQWLPDIDPILIGPENYAELKNLRYKDSGLEGVNGYTKVNSTALTTYTKIRTGIQLRTNKTQDSYILVQAVDGSEQGRVYVNKTAPGSTGDFESGSFNLDTSGNPYFADASSGLQGRFSAAPQGNVAYCNSEESMIYGGEEQRVGACFTVDDATLANPIDVTKEINNTLDTADERFSIDASDQGHALIMTTRPIQALKIYVKTANTVTSTLTVKTWTGAAFGSDLVSVDGTSSGGISLAQTGIVTLSSHTDGTSVLKHFEELYLYAYLIELVDGTNLAQSDIYHITVDFAFQSVKDVWDGVYRQPIQFQVKDDTASTGGTFDYTLQVNESSDINAPVGAILTGSGSNAGDKVYVMFEDQVSAIKFTVLGNLTNRTVATMTMNYWDGDSYSALTITDGTIGVATKTLSQTGLVTWTPPSDERPRQLYGSFGYVYEIDFSAALANGSDEVIVDLCTGVPAAYDIRPFTFSALYGTRLMECGYKAGDEGNRIDYSVANAPDAFNGFDSSDNGKQSLYFGGVEDVVAATQIYNRFGSSIYTLFLVMKRNETYVLIGDTPEEFTIYDVAKTIGCVAPLSLATAEVGIELGTGLTRQVAIWLSHSGPMLFDGALLTPIPGVRSYFDPNDDNYIEFDVVKRSVGWYDSTYKEYNLLIPSGSGETANNLWLVYDLVRRKWFTKDPQLAQFPQTGFEIIDADNGRRYIYGGIDTGFMVQLENGTTWGDGSATGIRQAVKTGDFFPSGNVWDETTIRKFKLFFKRLASSTDYQVTVDYYTNTEEHTGAGTVWVDSLTDYGTGIDWVDTSDVLWSSASAFGVSITANEGLQRVVRIIQDLNQKGWAHAFEFILTTTDVTRGFQPIIWGIQYRIERKDNTSTG